MLFDAPGCEGCSRSTCRVLFVGLVQPALRRQRAAKIVPSRHERRIEAQRFPVLEHGPLGLARHHQRGAQIEMGDRRCRADPSGGIEMGDGCNGLPELEGQRGRLATERHIARLALDQSLVANHILRRPFLSKVAIQPVEIATVAWQYLNPEVSHLVERTRSPSDAPRRQFWIAGVLVAVVVDCTPS